MLGFGWQEKELRSNSRRCWSLSSHSKGNSPCPKFPWFLPAFSPHKMPPKCTEGYDGNYERKKEHLEFRDLGGRTARCKTGTSLVDPGGGKSQSRGFDRGFVLLFYGNEAFGDGIQGLEQAGMRLIQVWRSLW